MNCECQCLYAILDKNGKYPCGFIQYLVDNNQTPNCFKATEHCLIRPIDNQPVGHQINLDSYGPQTFEEIQLAKDLGLF